jgi:hypothetical protein
MASTREIRGKIRSIENTRKITRAMQMVAASKMCCSQECMRAARPYGEKIRNPVAHMSYARLRRSLRNWAPCIDLESVNRAPTVGPKANSDPTAHAGVSMPRGACRANLFPKLSIKVSA